MQRPLIRSIAAVALFATAISLGYLLSSSLSGDYLRLEAETQLTSLMRGPTSVRAARLRLARGLWIEGEDVKVYPGESQHGLTGRRVSARIDLVALLTGRFRLRELVLEGVHMEIERTGQDIWWPHPIAALDTRGKPEDPDDLELKLNILRSFEAVLRGLLRGPTVAQRIELRGGSVRLVDRFVGGRNSEPLVLEIDNIDGELDFGWLNRSADLRLRGAWKDGGRALPRSKSTAPGADEPASRRASPSPDFSFRVCTPTSNPRIQPRDASERPDARVPPIRSPSRDS